MLPIVKNPRPMIGWREWISLPILGACKIKAKIDTGARTSALHAIDLKTYKSRGKEKIKFKIHPLQGNSKKIITCHTDIFGQRIITDSGGHRELRYVIFTQIKLGDYIWPIEITLTERHSMQFRMLLGRAAIRKQFTVNPAKSFIISREDNRQSKGLL